ncbi:Asp-tRNA(Asn)/Glu-tRNA(Gln) amidotransferase subunit GatC [Polluticaenibacter yanchengensis]|uniref:Aspartyl/glutamyl-tRNA(Asn/Gln) amidotransferase subunit C n=1 Tax=Polluticaenibacter yanchengensis TaxID=3014562 RepID=A0ABT4UKT4_9BACT|nr:Asp-tRNA(Asn)/Glu-tRNA(Gln) amidotransferase subunit GatC [Chitinophagaceae bacterium LY-5]
MEVNTGLIDHLAHLSRLNFTETEKETMRGDLEKMIGFVDKLNEIDTTDVKPLRHMSEAMNVYREDVLQGSVSTEEALQNAALKSEEFFKVPKVINK